MLHDRRTLSAIGFGLHCAVFFQLQMHGALAFRLSSIQSAARAYGVARNGSTMFSSKYSGHAFVPQAQQKTHHSLLLNQINNRQVTRQIGTNTLWSTSDNENESNDGKDIEPTWTYTPYKPPSKKGKRTPPNQQQRRQFSFARSEWTVPKSVTVPEDSVEFSYVRSSGAGGQNVNKLNTKAELRFHVMAATWMPKEVRERLVQQQANRINKEGYLTLSSQEYRTQGQNRKDVVQKVESMVLQAWPRPKERKLRKGISKAAKERNKEAKRRRSDVKKNRGRVDF